MSRIYTSVTNNSDLALVLAIVGILTILFVPIPAPALDFFIICNFCFALLLLLLTFYTHKPVELSTFPSLLLIATLFRLSLNIAATRLILSDAHAGKVIGAVGDHVVGGNYVIGVIVFLILVVVQYVVVTAGAQRVAEVAARFTLDSMPGQQMSIDADLNMGFIDQAEAQKRRKGLEKEANFYGAMDGASKFVKGDAIAGIVILLINICGGFAIGIWQHGMPWLEALQQYTLLTIGDGIVTQVPALIISIGTGIIVTRSAEDSRLSNEALMQMMAYPRTLMLVLGALAIMLVLPGLPAWPVLGVAFLVALFWMMSRRALQVRESSSDVGEAKKAGKDSEADNVYAQMEVFPLEIRIDQGMLDAPEFVTPPFLERVRELRSRLALELGFVLPELKLRPHVGQVQSGAYSILINGVDLARGLLRAGDRLVISSANQPVPGLVLSERDPVFGMPAAWVSAATGEQLAAKGQTVADSPTILLTHLTDIVGRHMADLFSRSELDRLLEFARKRNPGLVEDLIPNQLPASDVHRVLQNLLVEKVSIRNIDAILETLADKVRGTKDLGALTDFVRQKLAAAIYQSLADSKGELSVLTLDPLTEVALAENVRKLESGGALSLDPRLTEQLILRLSEQVERMLKDQLKPVLLCQPEVRRHLRTFLDRVLPQLSIVSLNELPGHATVKSFATVNLGGANNNRA